MIGPLDLERLANRIERLERTRTHGWHAGDELEFRNGLPKGFGRDKLPDPKHLRGLAKNYDQDTSKSIARDWQRWLQKAMRLEGLIRDNDPRNPKRMMRDMARGKMPGRGWR